MSDEVCRVCDGGPGNNGVCLCGQEAYEAPAPVPLGYNLAERAGMREAVLDYVRIDGSQWLFTTGNDPEVSDYTFEVPRTMAVTQEQAEAIAVFALTRMEWGRQAGAKQGQAKAQRFFRMALGLEAPDERERVYWDNPVPLATTDAMKEVQDVQQRVHCMAQELGLDG